MTETDDMPDEYDQMGVEMSKKYDGTLKGKLVSFLEVIHYPSHTLLERVRQDLLIDIQRSKIQAPEEM